MPSDGSGVSQTEIVVKFDFKSLSEDLLAVPYRQHASADTCLTGIPAVDAVITRFGEPIVLRPYLMHDQQPTREERCWFMLRFGEPVDIQELHRQLAELAEVDALEFVYRVRRSGAGGIRRL